MVCPILNSRFISSLPLEELIHRAVRLPLKPILPYDYDRTLRLNRYEHFDRQSLPRKYHFQPSCFASYCALDRVGPSTRARRNQIHMKYGQRLLISVSGIAKQNSIHEYAALLYSSASYCALPSSFASSAI